MNEEGQSVDGFMFFNSDARTKGPEALLRSMKRPHVMRQHYRKVRRQRMEALSSSSGDSSVESSAGSPAALITAGTKRKEQLATRLARDFHQSQKPVYGTDEDFQYQNITSSPHSMLGQGRLDPFKLFPADNVPVLVQKLLDHGECP
jgi:hypothetical protein